MLNREELQLLIEIQHDRCVSIYLPTHRAGTETRQDRIRLKNLLREARNRLLAPGLEETDVRRLLRPAHRLLVQDKFWQDQSDGLAMFLTEKFFRYYRVPLSFPEVLVVTGRFHLKPLLRYLLNDGHYYLLGLSQNRVRLFEGSRYQIHEVAPPGLPSNLAEAMGEEEIQKQLQSHTSRTPGGNPAAIFHGQGGEDEVHQDRLLRFCRKIDAGLRDILKEERAPLILMGVEYLHPIYRAANTYPHLADEAVRGNPERMSLDELRKEAWAVARPHYQHQREEAAELYRQLRGTGKTTDRVGEAVVASAQGRISTLFVPVGVQRWGSFDEEDLEVTTHSEARIGDEDLFDRAALQTLATGGKVFAVEAGEIPGRAPLAAIFRY